MKPAPKTIGAPNNALEDISSEPVLSAIKTWYVLCAAPIPPKYNQINNAQGHRTEDNYPHFPISLPTGQGDKSEKKAKIACSDKC